MKNIALIQNGMVINIACWDGISPWNPGDQYTQVDITNLGCIDGSGIESGCLYDGTNFSPPLGE